MRSLIALSFGLLTVSPVTAQVTSAANPGAYTDAVMFQNFARTAQSYDQLPHRDTPAQQRARLAKAVSLRSEYFQLQAADGGTLTPKHLAYVRTRARAILTN